MLNIRNARTGELDEVVRVIPAAYSQYSTFMPTDVWQPYARNLAD